MSINTEDISLNVFDVMTGSYGYAQLLDVHEADELINEDTLAEVCQDLNRNNSDQEHNLIKVGFLLGVAAAVEQEE